MTTTNFLGIPVEGDIIKSSRVAQQTLEEFQPLLQAVLDDPTMVEFGWRQATPYFNDGEPCEFSAHGAWFRTDADADVEDTYELEVDYSHPTLGTVSGGEWVDDPAGTGRRIKVGAKYEGPDEARFERCKALHAAIEGGHFYDVLINAFGDHAYVTVRREGIEVEYYEHD
ncbi:hypothetical protein AB0D97_12525 [Streptomyces roseus]|uniref:hypothetical protein n=1 Tax=Streptomyces roseus TaxID=66430 RepID=UPI0034067699